MVPTVGIVIYKIKVIAVIQSAEMSLSHGKADTVCETLTKGTCGDFDAYIQILSECEIGGSGQVCATISVVCLWVARG